MLITSPVLLLLGTVPLILSGTKPVLRVTTGEFARTIEAKYDSEKRPILTGGVAFNYLAWLTQRYHWDYNVTRFYNTSGSMLSIGTLRNGTWISGVMWDLTNDVADIALGAFGVKNQYVQHAEITYPWFATSFSMFIPYPQVENSIWASLKPFTPTVWLLLLVSFIAVAFTLWTLSSLPLTSANVKQKKLSFGTILLSLLAVLTGQGGFWNYHGRFLLSIGFTWCTAALVIVNAYNGRLTSYLSTVTPKPIVTSLEDLASKPDIKYYSFQYSWVVDTFKLADSGTRKTLSDGFTKHPERILPLFTQCLEQVAKGGSVCLTETDSGEQFIQKKLEEEGKCVATNIQRGFTEFNPSFFVRKNSALFPQVNTGIVWINALGLSKSWGAKYNVRVRNCLPPKGSSTSAQRLAIQNLSGPFLLLLAGYALGTVVFICECIYYRVKLQVSTAKR